MFDIIGKRNYFFAFSLLILIPGLIAILATPLTGGKAGLKFSVDYTGGTVWEFQLKNQNASADEVKSAIVGVDPTLKDAEVTKDTGGYIRFRTSRMDLQPAATKPPSPSFTPAPSASGSASGSASASASASESASASPSASPSPSASESPSASASASASASPSASESASASPSASASASASASPSPTPTPTPTPTPGVNAVTGQTCGPIELPQSGLLKKLSDAVQAKYGPISCTSTTNTVGAIISSDLITQTILLIILGSFGILAWIWIRFSDYKMGTTAVIALVHDVIVVVGIFAILGTFFNVEIDALFVTAMLTVIGFSVHDTIVVFDRIRENKARHAGEPFDMIVNHSILQTLGRSISTSFTVVITLLALYLFAGSTIHYFVLALLIGIISGTYSSIFNASPLLVVWQLWEDHRKAKQASAVRARRANA